jgi:hypothetical protein
MSDDKLNFAPGMTHGAPGFYLTGEENLRLTTFGALAGAVVTIEGRLITPEGTLEIFGDTQTPNSDRTAKSTVYALREGFLTNVQIRVTTGAALRGHIFAVLELVRGQAGAVQPLGTILQGYVVTNGRLAWPGAPIEASVAGRGRLRSITGADPAVGAEVSETVPAGVRWLLHSFRFTFQTSAVVATRTVGLTIDDGATVFLRIGDTNGQAASFNHGYTFADFGSANLFSSTQHFAPLPNGMPLAAGFRIRTSTVLLDGGDDFGAPQYLVEEFLEP